MLKPLVILGLALTFTGCATTSSNSAALANDDQQVAEKEESEKKYICKRVSKVGSHFRERKCWTQEEYAKRKEQDRETMEYLRNRQLGGNLPVENK